jgi:hypothetical protein
LASKFLTSTLSEGSPKVSTTTSISFRPAFELPEQCKIWGFHGGDYEEWCLLGSYAVWLL